MNSLKIAFLTISIVVSVSGQQFADLIIVNARVRTMDAKKPVAEAVAVVGERIVAIGSNNEVRTWASAKTKIISADGKLVLPGFNDAHVHFTGVGNWFSHLDASRVKSSHELLARIAHFTKFLPKGRWVLGAKLDAARWEASKLPMLAEIDAVSEENPVFLYLADPNRAFVNTAALQAAKVTLIQPFSTNSLIERDQNGRATGLVHGAALTIVRNAVPKNNATNWAEIAEAASNYAASRGVTSVQDVHSDNLLVTYREMAKTGRLKTRIYECVGLSDWEKNAIIGVPAIPGDAMVRGGCIKWLADGSLEERAELGERIAKADKAGLQVMVHAIGAAANKNTIDAFEFAASKNGARDRRFRIEHAHLMRSADILRLSPLNIIPSMQPALFYNEGDTGGDDFGSILRSGAKAAFGSDASMIDIDPLLGIHAAVNSGKFSISVEQAVTAYTVGSAYAEFQEKEKGILSVGKLVDMVILSDDIFGIDPKTIRDTKVVMTILGGKIVYDVRAN